MTMRFATLMTAVLTVAACSGSPSAGEPRVPPAANVTAESLLGTHWHLVSAGSGVLSQHVEAQRIEIEFAADQLAGNGGCNRYSGSYSLQDGVLTVGPVAATKRACIGSGNDVESAWFAALGGPIAVERDGTQLSLRTASGDLLTFAPGPAKSSG